jgi:hypothetical protein
MLAAYFAALAGVPPTDEPWNAEDGEVAGFGKRRFVHHKCVQCHPASGDRKTAGSADPEDLSIDLRLAKQRLRPSWVRNFLARPKSVVGTATRMPAVFYDSDAAPKVDDPVREIAAITEYLGQLTELPSELPTVEATTPAIDWTTEPY